MKIDKHMDGDILTIKLSGILDEAANAEICRDLIPTLKGTENIRVDLSDITDVESKGIEFLMILKKMYSEKGSMKIACKNSKIRKIFDITMLSNFLPFEEYTVKQFKREVAVIGAGPAGLMAALELARSGVEVVLLEKKQNLGVLNRACSMQFILDDDYEGEGVRVEEGKLVFPKSGFSVDYSGQLVPINNKYYHSPKGNVIRFARDNGNKPFSYKFDKRHLLLSLYHQCLEAGVIVVTGATVIDVQEYDDRIDLSVFVAGKGLAGCTCKKLIDAEGVNAKIASKLSMCKGRNSLTTALCCKYTVKGLKDVEPNSWNLYYGRAYHSNAAVIIGPSLRKDCVEITITSDKRNKPDSVLFDLVANSPLSYKFDDCFILDKTACIVHAFMPLKNPCSGNCIIIGDTAAFIEVEVQGALLCGYHAANAVIKELNGQDGWGEYTKWWQKNYEFNGDDYMEVSQGYGLVPVYTDDEVDYLFSLVEGECLEGTYSQYKTPKLMWNGFLKHADRIKQERPELYEKIKVRSNVSLTDCISD